MNIVYELFGSVVERFVSLFERYKALKIKDTLGGGKREIAYPYDIAGVENIQMEEPSSIGPNSTIYTTRAKLIIKQHFLSGPGLTIITGDHMPIMGRFIDTISDADKDELDTQKVFDQDVVIEEDVWLGANVTILKGVTIGRGCIIASGAVITKDIPPYSVAGGVPAKVIKKRMSDDEIKVHESNLYNAI